MQPFDLPLDYKFANDEEEALRNYMFEIELNEDYEDLYSYRDEEMNLMR